MLLLLYSWRYFYVFWRIILIFRNNKLKSLWFYFYDFYYIETTILNGKPDTSTRRLFPSGQAAGLVWVFQVAYGWGCAKWLGCIADPLNFRCSVGLLSYSELTKTSTVLPRLAVLFALSAARCLVLIFVNPLYLRQRLPEKLSGSLWRKSCRLVAVLGKQVSVE